MTEFVISGVLDEGKNLLFEGTPTCNQGENQTTKLSVTVPNAMAEGVTFYFEFLCPHNLWVSPKAETVVDGDYTVVSYVLGGYILREEGQVIVQLVARSTDDQTVVYKSVLSSQSCIYVERSVNVQTSAKAEDFFGQAANTLQQLANNDYITAETLTPLLPQRVGQLENDVGYITADDVSNAEVLINLGSSRRIGRFYLNQTPNQLITLPEYPVVNDAKITIYQGGYARGTFTLNQDKNVYIYLDGATAATTYAGGYEITHNDYAVIDNTEDFIIDLIVSPVAEYYLKNDDGSEDGLIDEVVLNGVYFGVSSESKYKVLQLIPQHLEQRWEVIFNGVSLGHVPYQSPDEGYSCLTVGVTMCDSEGNAFVHYCVR